jgi:isopropylmalate/homocitrate/citramalate synthase
MNASGSPYNYLSEARRDLALPQQVTLNDVTLREGLQASSRRFTAEDKLRLARLLQEVGLPQIQIGYPARSPVDWEVTARIKEEDFQACVEVICTVATEEWEKEVEQATRSGADFVNIIFPTSDLRLELLHISRKEMLQRIEEAVRLAKRTDVSVGFSPVDCTRTNLGSLKEILSVVTSAGADRFYIIDTAGVIYPLGMRYLATELRQAAAIPLAVHCHNDLGLALANSLVAVECGVEVVDVCVNGLGKRAGNVALDEMVMALWLLHNFDLGVKMDRLYDLSQAVAELTGIPVSESKPLTGRNAFDFEVDKQLRGEKAHVSWGAVEPHMVGHRRYLNERFP